MLCLKWPHWPRGRIMGQNRPEQDQNDPKGSQTPSWTLPSGLDPPLNAAMPRAELGEARNALRGLRGSPAPGLGHRPCQHWGGPGWDWGTGIGQGSGCAVGAAGLMPEECGHRLRGQQTARGQGLGWRGRGTGRSLRRKGKVGREGAHMGRGLMLGVGAAMGLFRDNSMRFSGQRLRRVQG